MVLSHTQQGLASQGQHGNLTKRRRGSAWECAIKKLAAATLRHSTLQVAVRDMLNLIKGDKEKAKREGEEKLRICGLPHFSAGGLFQE